MFDKLFDLPAHPLLIHAPIVLLPIAAIVTVVLAVKRDWRQRAGWFPVAGVFVVTVLLFGAKQSGESFSDAFDAAFGAGSIDIDRHQELGNMTFVLTLVWLVAVIALTVWEFVRRRNDPGVEGGGDAAASVDHYVGHVLGTVASAFAILATIWLIRTGHEGADVVWSPLVPQLFPEG